MADCKAYREEIEESAGVESLSLDARTHAGACTSCGEFGRERDALRRLVGGLGKVEAPADFEFRLRARMKATRSGGGKYNFLGKRFAPGLAWTAAACFLAISASLYLWQELRSPGVVQQASRSEQSEKGHPGVGVENEAVGTASALKAEVKGSAPIEQVARNKVADNTRRISSRLSFREVSQKESRKEVPSSGSSMFSVGSAKILRLKIPLGASPESLRFVMTDERGKTRPVPMRAVSFGSQEMVAGVNGRGRVVATDKGGVW